MAEIEPVGRALPDGMPGPRVLQKALREHLEAHIVAARMERTVSMPEDTYELVRSLHGSAELMEEYADSFKAVAKIARQEIEEELVTAVGEQDGIPNYGMTVPDAAGDIRLSLDVKRDRYFDLDQIQTVLIYLATTAPDLPEDTEERQAEIARNMWQFMVAIGSFTPQVSKLKTMADAASRDGLDSLAAVLRSAVTTKEDYTGIKVKRA